MCSVLVVIILMLLQLCSQTLAEDVACFGVTPRVLLAIYCHPFLPRDVATLCILVSWLHDSGRLVRGMFIVMYCY